MRFVSRAALSSVGPPGASGGLQRRQKRLWRASRPAPNGVMGKTVVADAVAAEDFCAGALVGPFLGVADGVISHDNAGADFGCEPWNLVTRQSRYPAHRAGAADGRPPDATKCIGDSVLSDRRRRHGGVAVVEIGDRDARIAEGFPCRRAVGQSQIAPKPQEAMIAGWLHRSIRLAGWRQSAGE